MKILIRGGSIPFGYQTTKSYVDILSDLSVENNFELINRSYLRDNSFEAVRTFHIDVLPYRPDIVILHYALDDAYLPVYRSEFKENLVQFIKLARNSFKSAIVLLTSHPFADPYEMNEVNIYYRTIREVSDDLNCDYIPIHILWYSLIEEFNYTHEEFLNSDERYPNEKGHQLYAKAIGQLLLKKIEVIKCQ